MNSLEALGRVSTIVADTADYESLARFAPRDATTNPSLVLRAVSQPRYAHLRALPEVRSAAGRDADAAMDRLLVHVGCEILQRVPGRVSTEVDARLSHDCQATVARARSIHALYAERGVPASRVLIKIASTWAGISAARQLQDEGIACNLTLLFSFVQGRACAAAAVQLVSPFVGRITDWHRQEAGSLWDAQAMRGEQDPGVRALLRLWRFYKSRGVATEIMGASFRDTAQIAALAGCDLLTISPALLEQLAQSDAPMPRQLDATRAGTPEDDEPLAITQSAFAAQLDADRMARTKLAEGIAQFSADTTALLALLRP